MALDGLVLRSTGSWYEVALPDGRTISCRLKGKFRQDDKQFTNPVAVGDRVEVEVEPSQETGIIGAIKPRHNYIVRASTRKRHSQHILAANIDQALLVVTFKFPNLKLGFIDRFLVVAEAYHIPAVIVVNKVDLLDAEDLESVEGLKYIYEAIGYPVVAVSALEGTNMEHFRGLLMHKVSLIGGHSGVGKSTLINMLYPELQLKTAPLSGYTGKGRHTTTFATMHPIVDGGYLIDTPGIKELGVVDMKPEELSHYFPEMRRLLAECRYRNCTHVDEPDCAVKQAVQDGRIVITRYENYLHILGQVKEHKPW